MRRIICLLAAAVMAVAFVACSVNGSRTVVAEFADVGDLVGRANVQQSDAVIGTIRSIKLVDRSGHWIARVTMTVDPKTEVTDASQAVVRSTSLLGEKYVDLVGGSGRPLGDNAVIPVSRTSKAPELEAVFSQLGAILASGALEDLGKFISASAMIVQGQEDDVGRVFDQTAKLVASLHAQKDALVQGIASLDSAAKTLAQGKATLGHGLDVSDGALKIVASQQQQLDELVVQLDRLGKPLGQIMRDHSGDIDKQIRDVNAIVPKLYQVRSTLERAVEKLPHFTTLFPRAAPGDYVQLDVFIEALPIGTPASASKSVKDVFLEAAR